MNTLSQYHNINSDMKLKKDIDDYLEERKEREEMSQKEFDEWQESKKTPIQRLLGRRR